MFHALLSHRKSRSHGGRRTASILCALAVLLPALCHAQQATYTNPLIAADFPDPTALRDTDGTYWVYGTVGGRPEANIQIAHSKDLVHWTRLGDALPVKPAWANQKHNFCEPDVLLFGGTYYMYFAAESNSSTTAETGDGVHGMCLGVATSRTAAGPFVDSGAPLLCGASFIDIDPMAFDDPATGKHLLYWGSGFRPIEVQ